MNSEAKMSETILRMEDILNTKELENKPKEKRPKEKKNKPSMPRGIPKSGRVWKTEKKRFKSIIKTRGLKRSHTVEKFKKLKDELKRAKLLTDANKEARKQEIERKKERRRENLKRQEQNRLKSEVVQVIKNTSKLKRMRKKQLRQIEKRDTTEVYKTTPS